MKTKCVPFIYTLYEEGFGAKAIRASYSDKNWRWNMLKTIWHRIDKTGSAVTRLVGSGRLICHKSSWIRQSYHFRADFSRVLLQLVDILNTLFNMPAGQLTFIAATFKLFLNE